MKLVGNMLRIRSVLPIILCTGYSPLIGEAQAKKHGIQNFAMNPLSKKDTAVLLRKALDTRTTDSSPIPQPEVHQP